MLTSVVFPSLLLVLKQCSSQGKTDNGKQGDAELTGATGGLHNVLPPDYPPLLMSVWKEADLLQLLRRHRVGNGSWDGERGRGGGGGGESPTRHATTVLGHGGHATTRWGLKAERRRGVSGVPVLDAVQQQCNGLI